MHPADPYRYHSSVSGADNSSRIYVLTLNNVDTATLDDLRGAMTMLEKAERTARRVLGSGHPLARAIGQTLRNARVVLRAREMRQS